MEVFFIKAILAKILNLVISLLIGFSFGVLLFVMAMSDLVGCVDEGKMKMLFAVCICAGVLLAIPVYRIFEHKRKGYY